jgi:HAMP domain-containing protein
MLDIVKRKLSLKVAVLLGLVTAPVMVLATYVITTRETESVEQLSFATARAAAIAGARMYGAALDAGVESGAVTVNDLLDTSYEPIKGYEFGDNPKYHTRYDFFTDRAVLGLQDTILQSSPSFLFVAGNDVNGYVPTHDSKFQPALSGDAAKDTANRAKRKWPQLIQQNVGHELDPVSVHPYQRDTGEQAWDVSAPVFVKGRYWGSLHIGMSAAAIHAAKMSLITQLLITLGILGTITTGFILVTVRRSMRPLEQLTELANQISSGEKLGEPIKATTSDEIGNMAQSLNRLRASLAAAMQRLGV